MASSRPTGTKESSLFPRASLFANICLAAAAVLWLNQVNTIVPEPYIDELFHVRQAQKYCRGDFAHWDPKITTPPGLYLISWLLHKIGVDCSTAGLRSVGWVLLSYCIYNLVFNCRAKLQHGNLIDRLKSRPFDVSDVDSIQALLRDVHTSINICLFPPLFFFSGLYYTDVASTLFVLLCYEDFVHRSDRSNKLYRDLRTISLGLIALLFRQTNIFWVAIFPAGLTLVDALKAGCWDVYSPKPSENHARSWEKVIRGAWDGAGVYDPAVHVAFVDDYFKTAAAIVVCAARQSTSVLPKLIPYLSILGAFGAFVFWNGGVVLGDKSNHIATLHLPQMLYLWPYITFFSFPLIYPHILSTVLPHRLLPRFLRQFTALHSRRSLPRRQVVIGFLAIAATATHFNTIVHPFTLADNRHYTFYVFRHLLRHPALKSLVTPIYLATGWAVLQTLSSTHPPRKPRTTATPPPPKSQAQPSTPAAGATDPATPQSQTAATTPPPTPPHSVPLSFTITWLAATSLSLITAPLVEPRYCIIPWLLWRLHIPDFTTTTALPPKPSPRARKQQQQQQQHWRRMVAHGDHRLWLETGWFLAVGGVTGYVFLWRGFGGGNSEGVQRFMW